MTWKKYPLPALVALTLIAHIAAAQSRWSFDVDFSDSGGAGNDLSVAQGSVSLTPGFLGSAANFDGAAYLATLSADLALPRSAFTLSAWLNVDAAQPTPDAGIAAQSNLAYGMTLHNGRIYAYVDTGGNALFYPYRSRGGWHHVAEVFDGATISLYIDGVFVASQVSTSGTTGPGAEFRVGKSYGSSALLVGKVDELSFTDVALDRDGVRLAAGLQAVPPIAVGDLLVTDVTSGSVLRVGRDSCELLEQFVPANSGEQRRTELSRGSRVRTGWKPVREQCIVRSDLALRRAHGCLPRRLRSARRRRTHRSQRSRVRAGRAPLRR